MGTSRLLLMCTLLVAGPALGDTLLIERTQRAAGLELPKRGTLMKEVEARFGAPLSKSDPVGGDSPVHPPITRWTYAQFAVYFEHDHVIDSVVLKSDALEQGPKDPPAK